MQNKSKKFLKLGNFIYGDKIQILLIDSDKLLFLRRYKNFRDLIKIGLKDKRIYRLLAQFVMYKVKYFHAVFNPCYRKLSNKKFQRKKKKVKNKI